MAQLRSSVWCNRAFTVQTVAPDVELLHLTWSVQGEFEPDGTLRRSRTGVFTWLLTARGGQWRIRATHATHDANSVALQ
jgi:ketosteroid isomerase-like protein